VAARLGRPSSNVAQRSAGLVSLRQRMLQAVVSDVQWKRSAWQHMQQGLLPSLSRAHQAQRERTARAGLRLELLDPSLVLRRGYAWLSDASGQAVTRAAQLQPGDHLRATLADGAVDVQVSQQASN